LCLSIAFISLPVSDEDDRMPKHQMTRSALKICDPIDAVSSLSHDHHCSQYGLSVLYSRALHSFSLSEPFILAAGDGLRFSFFTRIGFTLFFPGLVFVFDTLLLILLLSHCRKTEEAVVASDSDVVLGAVELREEDLAG
jgi:hypothetical protein